MEGVMKVSIPAEVVKDLISDYEFRIQRLEEELRKIKLQKESDLDDMYEEYRVSNLYAPVERLKKGETHE